MSKPHLDQLEAARESIYGKARFRWRMERLFDGAGVVLPVVALALAGCAVATLLYAKLALMFPMFLGIFAAVLLVLAAWAFLAPIQPKRLWARLDRVADLKDGVLTMEEISRLQGADKARADWALAQRARVSRELNWDRVQGGWPLRLPRTAQWAGALCALTFAFFATGFYRYTPPAEEVAAKQMIEDQTQVIEEIAQDWEKLEKEQPSEELKRALEELKPLRDRLAKGDITEKELVQELARVEEKLRDMQADAKRNGMDPALAREIAEALEPMQGSEQLAAALRKNDMEAANKAAEELAEKWDKPDAKILAAALSQEAKDKLAKAADKADAAKMESLAKGMREMAKEGECKDGKCNGNNMAKGMRSMKDGMKKAGQSQSASAKLALQLLQIGQCKSCMGGACKPSFQISLFQTMSQSRSKGGSKAGTATTGNPFGGATESRSNLKEEKLTGMVGEGDSETTTEQSNTPTPAGNLASRQASFKSYEKLSKVAIEDENLPLAHRESIKRYFESIRPKDKQ